MSITATTVTVQNIESAISILKQADFDDISLLDNDVAVVLQENIFDFCDTVEAYLSTIVGSKKAARASTSKIEDVTISTLVRDLESSKNILIKSESFGLSRLSVKVMKGIRVKSEAIKASATDILVESIKYKAYH